MNIPFQLPCCGGNISIGMSESSAGSPSFQFIISQRVFSSLAGIINYRRGFCRRVPVVTNQWGAYFAVCVRYRFRCTGCTGMHPAVMWIIICLIFSVFGSCLNIKCKIHALKNVVLQFRYWYRYRYFNLIFLYRYRYCICIRWPGVPYR